MFYDEAMTYLSMGWCVYPAHSVTVATGLCSCGRMDCPCPGKHPIGSWSEYSNRLPSKREAGVWFSSLDCNIGTVTGLVSGIAVVDVDGEKGLASLEKLNLDRTLMAKTGGGGYHMFYSLSKPTRTRTQVFEGIDIRGDGGYVILAPSLHRSGRRYEWLDPIYDLAPFDSDLFDRVGVPTNGNGNGWNQELLQGVSEGSRSTSAAKLAGRYFAMGLNAEEVWILMVTWNERNDPPLIRSDLRRTVEGIKRRHEEVTAPIQIKTLGQIRDLLSKGASYER